MRSIITVAIVIGLHPMATSGSLQNDHCQQILPIISNMDAQDINRLYLVKQQNNGQFKFSGTVENTSYTIEPKKRTIYKVSWRVKNRSNGGMAVSGDLECDVPTGWQLTLKKHINVVYPRVTHGLREESPYQQIDTVFGIYLAKSKFSVNPDIVRLMWHLRYDKPPENAAEKIAKSSPPFFPEPLSVVVEDVDQKDQVRLVALHISDQSDIEKGGQQWLITNAHDQKAIRDGRYATDQSPHNAWLPWHDENHPEFSAHTAQEAYRLTVVAPLASARIFDRALGLFVPDPIAVTDKMQSVFDLVAPLAYGAIKSPSSLFIHLLLRSESGYELLTFDTLVTGAIEFRARKPLIDPSEIGLPSAQSLGFPDNDSSGVRL